MQPDHTLTPLAIAAALIVFGFALLATAIGDDLAAYGPRFARDMAPVLEAEALLREGET